MDSSQMLTTYNAILAITGKMLAAAQNNEWDQLILLEQECKQLTELLIQNDQEPVLDKDALQKKVQIIHRILDDDAQIKAITEPRIARLQSMLSTNSRERDLQQAYQ